MGHESDPRTMEIQNLRQQVERLTQRLVRLERREGFNDESDAKEFINPFHIRSPVKRRRQMERHENNDHCDDFYR